MRLLGVLFNALFGALMTAVLVLVVLVSAEEAAVDMGSEPLAPEPLVVVKAGATPRTVTVQLFEWRWDDIAVECETFLGPMGFEAVQVSPPNEHRLVAGYPWWQRYQPVSYELHSRSGDAEAFGDMVRRCADAGVKIYVDAVVNHMTGQAFEDDPLWGTGSAGSSYAYQQYPDFGPEDFHQPYCEIGGNYADRGVVQTCALLGLADLDTQADPVQDRIGGYLNRLLELGVSGFRIDAAKHMAAADIAGILARVHGLPFIVQEVIDAPGEPVRAEEYAANGLVTEFDYGRRVSAALRHGALSDLERFGQGLGADDLLPSHRALVFIDNHDNQRGHGGGGAVLTQRDGALYDLANVFMLAWPYGNVRVMSSYRFADTDAGPPSREDGTTLRVHGADGLGCGSGWICEHRRPAIAAMVGFRNATAGTEVTHWWNDEAEERIAFGRGELGFVVINNTDEPMKQWLRTGLPAGRYCNLLDGDLVGEQCVPRVNAAADADDAGSDSTPEPSVIAKDGSGTLSVPARAALVLLASPAANGQ